MSSTPESRRAAFDRAQDAAEIILNDEDVRLALNDTWAVLDAIRRSTYFANFEKRKASTPHDQKTFASIGVIEFGKNHKVRLSKHMSSLHERQLAEIAAVATANGQEAGPLIDDARLALDEIHRNSHPVVGIGEHNFFEATVSTKSELRIGDIDYQLRSRPTILLRENGYDTEWTTGRAFLEQMFASDQILRSPLVPIVDLDDETKKDKNELDNFKRVVAEASLRLLNKDVFGHSHNIA